MIDKKSKKTDKVQILPLLPLRDIVVFPKMIVPLFIGREQSINAIEEAMAHGKRIFLTAQKKANIDNPKENDLYQIGVMAEVLQLLKLPDGTVKVLMEGINRVEIVNFLPEEKFLKVSVKNVDRKGRMSAENRALMRSVNAQFEQYVKLNRKIPPEIIMSIVNIENPDKLADAIAAHLILKLVEKQEILVILNPKERLRKLIQIIDTEIEILRVEKKIRNQIKKQMEQTQREYYLTEQIKAIQKELGKKDEFSVEIGELRKKIKEAKMSKEANERALRELKKLEMMMPMSAEATVVRTYLDWLIELPWEKRTKDKLNIDEAEKILEEDHYGLKKVKERILEYLSVCQLVKKMKGPILCLVGPPGVGKTSLAKSIARATGREFVRLSLGGVRDEAEIRGHRRTYIGALPGRIIQSLRKVKSKNPIFLLDEVDKMSTDFRGDPSAALLEVLDPEQNSTFSDHYLEVEFNLSEIVFITTANMGHTIPQPLQDRMEIIRIAGYTELEKVKIAEQFLVSKQLQANGLTSKNLYFTESSLQKVIQRYTREAGVRSLEREIASICRKVAKRVVKDKSTEIKITSRNLASYLGIAKYRYGKIEEKSEVGLATGLAWTEVGGDILITEATIMNGKGKLILTGQLGDVMQESAQAALTYIRSKAKALGLPKDFYQKIDIHIHVPEGAIPKDGPSAGITMATALASVLIKKPIRKNIAMTGEITLRGRVLPIGGLKEKVLAAHRSEITTVIIPKENEKDLKDIPANIRRTIKFVLVDKMDEVLKEAIIDLDVDIFENQKGYDLKEIYPFEMPNNKITAH